MEEFNPYTAPQAELADPLPEEAFVLADRGTRFGAQFLDGLITGIPTAGAIFGVGLLMARQGQVLASTWPAFVLLVLAQLLAANLVFLAINGWLLVTYGQTVGKRICKIRIARKDGSLPGLMESFVRRKLLFDGIGLIPFAGSVFQLVDVLFIFRANRKCLHDETAGTLVIKS